MQHVFSADFQTPKGPLTRQPNDPDTFSIRALSLGEPFLKSSFVRRRRQEIKFGRLVGAVIAEMKPDVVLSSNAPLDTQRFIIRATRDQGASFVFWVQDLYGAAIQRVLSRKMGLFGSAVGAWYQHLERQLLAASDQVVIITEDFRRSLDGAGIAADRVHVIENWAPVHDLPFVSARAGEQVTFTYSGTLGYKHNPDLLLELAAECEAHRVLVYSEGPAARDLEAKAADAGVTNLKVRSWVPFDKLADTLSEADVLVVMIEADAGIYSVPSKVLTYLCVGRPILGSMPKENLAARIIEREQCGLINDPQEASLFLAHAKSLAADPSLRRAMGEAGRRYAEATFDVTQIGARFETVLTNAVGATRP